MNYGITSTKAAEFLKQYGYNELPSSKPKKCMANSIRGYKRTNVWFAYRMWHHLYAFGRPTGRRRNAVLCICNYTYYIL